MEQYEVTTDWLAARAADTPDAAAILVDGRWWRFGELDALASRLCARLAAGGARPGDHVAVLLPNSLPLVVAVFALARLGAVMVPLNTRLTVAEVAWQVARADCARLICAPATELQAADVPAILPRLVLATGATAFEAWAMEQSSVVSDQWPVISSQWSVSSEERADPPLAPLDHSQAIIFTSGTTGYAKGAVITFANHFWSAVGSAFRLGVVPGDRWLACLPLYHVGGLAVLFRACLYGTAVVLHEGFDTTAVRHSLGHDGVTLVSLVPTMLGRLLHEGLTIDDAPALRLILLGGAAAPAALLGEARAAGLPVAVTYGLTEAASQVATLLPDGVAGKPGSAGKPLLFTTVAVVDDAGHDLPPGEAGEIVVRGPTVMAGYYRDEPATAAALRDGRLHTGDIGTLDAGGDLWLLDRRADLIVSGGENVYPAEVERVLREHPAVALAAVVGLPHADWGQQVAAAVVLRSPGAATTDELLAHCRARLAGYKRPRQLVLRDALPQTASGKVQRRLVAEQLLAAEEGR
jgi:O-succinylbenzoic acid--CoA ligase